MASLKCLGIIFSILSAYAEPQQFSNFPPYRQHPQLMNARTNPIGSSLDISPDSRLFLGNSLITYTAFTTTTTTTVSSTTICTTSNAVISTCSPSSGRRRRRLALDDTYGRSLFFTNDDEDEAEYGDIFLPITYAKTKHLLLTSLPRLTLS